MGFARFLPVLAAFALACGDAGASGTSGGDIAPQGFSGTVSLAVSGLATGVTGVST